MIGLSKKDDKYWGPLSNKSYWLKRSEELDKVAKMTEKEVMKKLSALYPTVKCKSRPRTLHCPRPCCAVSAPHSLIITSHSRKGHYLLTVLVLCRKKISAVFLTVKGKHRRRTVLCLRPCSADCAAYSTVLIESNGAVIVYFR